jgi:Coenzyme PQQ synthesis protein D (PqqD)
MSDQLLRPNSPSVVSEIIDGEAVIMNLATGHYFSAQGTGGELWALIENGASERRLVEYLLLRYRIDEIEARTGVAAFISKAREHDLVVTAPAESASIEDQSETPTPTDSYAIPQLHAYSDMEDLLLLDPIHDVSEAGWPMPKPVDS